MAYITSKLGPQKGFHPVSSTTIHLPSGTHHGSCSLYLYYTLPPLLFVDTHELAQRNASYHFRHWGSRDLEKPVHALPDEISELLVDIHLLEDVKTIHVEVPMHLRYGAPIRYLGFEGNQTGYYEDVRVSWPQGFLLCPPTSQVIPNIQSNFLPDDILSVLHTLKSDGLPIHIPPHVNFSSAATSLLQLPLGNLSDLTVVEPLTALTILLCFFWLFTVSWKAATRLNVDTGRPKTA